MKTEVRTITPFVAKEMLQRNPNNRKLSDGHVAFLANEMKKGNWLFDAQPIRLAESGSLLDGQHRLNAVVTSGLEQKFLIVSGIQSEAFKVMDTGRNRNAGDILSIEGIQYANQCASAARTILRIRKGYSGNLSSNNKLSNTDILDFITENKRIVEFARAGVRLSNEFDRVLSSSAITSFSYLMAEKNVIESEAFWNKLCTGLDLEKDSPIYVLRKKLFQNKISTKKLRRTELEVYIIKAWNFYRKGVTVKWLKYQESEKFPKIV